MEHRIDRLERRVRRLIALNVLLVGALVVGGVAAAAQQEPTHLIGRSLTLVDQNGLVCLSAESVDGAQRLIMGGKKPWFVAQRIDNSEQSILELHSRGSNTMLVAQPGQPRMVIKDGENDEARFAAGLVFDSGLPRIVVLDLARTETLFAAP